MDELAALRFVESGHNAVIMGKAAKALYQIDDDGPSDKEVGAKTKELLAG